VGSLYLPTGIGGQTKSRLPTLLTDSLSLRERIGVKGKIKPTDLLSTPMPYLSIRRNPSMVPPNRI
jgi:hypothetical protein